MMNWFAYLFRIWRREFKLVFRDAGVLIFFFGLPTLYPIVYTLIYNPEIVKEIPIVVVDDSRTAQSRELVRKFDATQAAKVVGYAASKSEARRWLAEKNAYAVIEIPADYARKLGRGEQADVNFYCDMSLLLRYRAMLLAFSQVQMAVDGQVRQKTIDSLGEIAQVMIGGSKPVSSNAMFIGDTTQGFASFVIPGLMVLILQQSLILGVTMLAGGRAERRRRNGGIDPEDYPGAPASSQVLGRMFCYLTLYAPMVLYMLYCIPAMFTLPDAGNFWQYWIFLMPMMIGASFLGMALGAFVTERESSMLVVVFTSVVFLFMSGLMWPRYAFPDFWRLASYLIPSTWGMEGFVRMLSNGATLEQQSHNYIMLWVLSAGYFVVAWLLVCYYKHTARLAGPKQA